MARYAWWQELLQGRSFNEEGFLLARLEIDYKKPILLMDRIRVELRCPRIGSSSFDIESRVVGEDGSLFAVGKTVQVAMDQAMTKPRPIGPETRAWLERHA